MSNTKFDNTHTMQNIDLTKGGHTSDGKKSPPMLSEAVLRATPTHDDKQLDLDPKSFAATMAEVFKQVYERLDKGLDEAWRSTWGYDGDPEDTPDEKWARQFTEMFLFCAYMGPALNYGTMNDKEDEADIDFVYPLDLNSADGKSDPSYAIVGACQHICNYMVLTRGYSPSALGRYGLTSGNNSSAPCFTDALGGSWKPLDNGIRNVSDVSKKVELTPGSMFCFEGTGRHIGGVLRCDMSSDEYQPMDTGVLAGATETGTADHEAQKTVNRTGSSTLIGVGVLSGTPPSDAWFPHLARARPLGFAHFVVTDTSNRVRFISRALPMHVDQKGFSIARYVWSLRYFPAKGRGYWILSIPNRLKSLSLALRRAGARGKSPADLMFENNVTGTNRTTLYPVNVIASTPGDGGGTGGRGAEVYRRKVASEVDKSDPNYDPQNPKWKTVDIWARYAGADTPVGTPPIPSDLAKATVEGKPFYSKWASMKANEEYSCTNPDAPVNAIVTTGVKYFGGAAPADGATGRTATTGTTAPAGAARPDTTSPNGPSAPMSP